MSTPFESGAKTETREGINIVRAASVVGVSHLVYSSVPAPTGPQAFRISTGKFEVEKELRRSGVPFTIVAPVFFHGELSRRLDAAGIRKRVDRAGVAGDRVVCNKLRVADIAQFNALVIERRGSFLGKRIDIASGRADERYGSRDNQLRRRPAVSSTRPFRSTQCVSQNEDLARMFELVRRVDTDADIVGLRSLYPEVDCTASALGSRAGLVSHHRPGDTCLILRCAARREANVLAMTLKIEIACDGETATFRLSGRIEQDHLVEPAGGGAAVPSTARVRPDGDDAGGSARVRFLAGMKGTRRVAALPAIHPGVDRSGADPRNPRTLT